MFNDFEKKLSLLQEPTAFGIKTFNELLHENVTLAKEILGSEWLPLESDLPSRCKQSQPRYHEARLP